MTQSQRYFWRVLSDGNKIFEERIGPFTKVECEEWAIAEIDATTNLGLTFEVIETAE
jgi:hypothetical protein